MQGAVRDKDGSVKSKTVCLSEGGVREEGAGGVQLTVAWRLGAAAHMALGD